jgi:hypothetical protein
MKFLVFDVESAGLCGQGFAVGYCIVDDESGMTMESDWRSAGINSVPCASEDLMWLMENLPRGVTHPESPLSLEGLREWFVGVVETHKDCCPTSDCGVPVESNFLSECGLNPYPLHEVATALLLAGRDPVGTYERLPYELPKHHPLYDARQSGRILLECIAKIRGTDYPPQVVQ